MRVHNPSPDGDPVTGATTTGLSSVIRRRRTPDPIRIGGLQMTAFVIRRHPGRFPQDARDWFLLVKKPSKTAANEVRPRGHGAHPDDEALGRGGSQASACQGGCRSPRGLSWGRRSGFEGQRQTRVCGRDSRRRTAAEGAARWSRLRCFPAPFPDNEMEIVALLGSWKPY